MDQTLNFIGRGGFRGSTSPRSAAASLNFASISSRTSWPHLEQIGDDQVIPVAGFEPEGQFVAASVAVVKEAALFDQQPASVNAGADAEPSHRRAPVNSSMRANASLISSRSSSSTTWGGTVRLTSCEAESRYLAVMSDARDPLYRRYRFPPEVISHAVWLYFRFPLSLRMGRGDACGARDLRDLRDRTAVGKEIRQGLR